MSEIQEVKLNRSTQITSQNNHFERWPNIQICMLCLAIYQTTNSWQYSRGYYFSGQWPHIILKRLHQKSLGLRVIAATIQTFVIMWSLKRQHGLVIFFKSKWVTTLARWVKMEEMGALGMRLIPGPNRCPKLSNAVWTSAAKNVLVRVIASFGPKMALETISEHLIVKKSGSCIQTPLAFNVLVLMCPPKSWSVFRHVCTA